MKPDAHRSAPNQTLALHLKNHARVSIWLPKVAEEVLSHAHMRRFGLYGLTHRIKSAATRKDLDTEKLRSELQGLAACGVTFFGGGAPRASISQPLREFWHRWLLGTLESKPWSCACFDATIETLWSYDKILRDSFFGPLLPHSVKHLAKHELSASVQQALLGSPRSYLKFTERVIPSLSAEAQQILRTVVKTSKVRVARELPGCPFDAIVSLLEYLLVTIRFSIGVDSVELELCIFPGHAAPFTLSVEKKARHTPWQFSLNQSVVFPVSDLYTSTRARNFAMRHTFLQRQLSWFRDQDMHRVLTTLVKWLVVETGEQAFRLASLPDDNMFIVRVGSDLFLVVHRNGFQWDSIMLIAKACGLLHEDPPRVFSITSIARAAVAGAKLPHATQVSWGRRNDNLRFRLSGSSESWPKWVLRNLRQIAKYIVKKDLFVVTPETLLHGRLPALDARILLAGVITMRSSTMRRLQSWCEPRARPRVADSPKTLRNPQTAHEPASRPPHI